MNCALIKGVEIQCRRLFGEIRQQVAKALYRNRDLNYLIDMGAIAVERLPDKNGFLISIKLDWPTKITETEFFQRVKDMPKGKVYGFLSA